MAKQFSDVSSKYGAPMGRRSRPSAKPVTRTVRLFLVRLVDGGYDDGGAYWGGNFNGLYLYCATDDADYSEFTRAVSRRAAAEALNIVDLLKVPA